MGRNNRNILVVDDEPKILEVVCMLLENRGFHTFQADHGERALKIFDTENISLVILDRMLPDISGEEICSNIRKKSRVPIIMLTAKVEEEDVVEGLFLGADDYILKPFGLKELYARIEAVLRRAENDLIPLVKRNSWRDGDFMVDFDKNEVRKKGVFISLTPSERKILAVLIKYPGKVFTRDELIESAMGTGFTGYDRAIDSHIKNLRKKVEDDPKNPVYIHTIPGLGYKFGG